MLLWVYNFHCISWCAAACKLSGVHSTVNHAHFNGRREVGQRHHESAAS